MTNKSQKQLLALLSLVAKLSKQFNALLAVRAARQEEKEERAATACLLGHAQRAHNFLGQAVEQAQRGTDLCGTTPIPATLCGWYLSLTHTIVLQACLDLDGDPEMVKTLVEIELLFTEMHNGG